ncbi:MAG: DivIVA domain-containing protein [Oscillospiraceae bacterium]|nr:DivIVA domain-containing protein [Oscillospiraceae bacterium]
MLTPQDIQEKIFGKAAFGGYDTAMVDDFLELVYDDYSALYKEGAILKSKLKVLVEKVEEYRSTEDSMRMALLTAQKMAGEIQAEARKKADAVVADAHEQAKRRSVELRQKLAAEEARLKEAERKTALFSERVLDMIAEEQTFIEQLKDFSLANPAAVEPNPALSASPKPVPAAEPEPVQERPIATPIEPVIAVPIPVAEAPVEDAFSLDEMESSVGAYLAQEVSRMSVDPEESLDDDSPFVEDVTVSARVVARDPFDEPEKTADVDFLKMFDQDHIEEPVPEPAPEPELKSAPIQTSDARADEKLDIARSISSALGDTEEISVDRDAFYDDEGQPTTTRPKFDFDDLQFGTNFHDEDDI